MSKEVEQARAALKGRLAALEVEGTQIRGALASLEGAPRQRRRRRPSSSPRRTRAKKGERQAQFKATLKENPNYRLSEIARSMGINSTRASNLAKQLVDSGDIKKVDRGQYRLA